ncbi:MAG: hypothetical protein KF866_01290 [Phycisphaeraceae bacterium]|nr:hypothetical protein [Phycisphaeraceae bacterium]MCW5755025.1 hypothetical protein [Phycisphaeraceae bacterium]
MRVAPSFPLVLLLISFCSSVALSQVPPKPDAPPAKAPSKELDPIARELGDAPKLLGLTPEAIARHPAPPVIRVGTRLLYDTGSSYANDANDHWLFHEQAGGGIGLCALDVAAIEGPAAVVVGQFFGYNPTSGRFEILGATSCNFGPAAAVGDFWIHPELLKSVDTTSAFRVRRGQYTLHGKVHNVLRVRVSSGSRTTQWMYDTDTGLLLIYRSGSTIVHASPVEKDDEDWDGVVLNHMTLVGVRHIEWPGMNGKAPEWCRNLKRMRYQGHHYVTLDGFPPTSGGAMDMEFRASARGNSMLAGELVDVLEESRAGRDALSRRAFASGVAGPGLLFITPEAFKAMRPGQVLEREERIGYELVVAHKDQQQVVIELRHPLFFTRRVYDREGRMIMVEQAARQLTGWQGWVQRLVAVE